MRQKNSFKKSKNGKFYCVFLNLWNFKSYRIFLFFAEIFRAMAKVLKSGLRASRINFLKDLMWFLERNLNLRFPCENWKWWKLARYSFSRFRINFLLKREKGHFANSHRFQFLREKRKFKSLSRHRIGQILQCNDPPISL